MQVANDVASAKELPSREARPGRRVNNSAAGKLQGGELREDCVEGALECGLAGGGPLERRPASKLRCDEGLGGKAQQRICYLDVYLQWRVQSVHRGEQGGQRAGVRLAEEGRVQGCRGDSAQESGQDPTAGRTLSVCLGGLQPRDGGVSARKASAAAVATLVSTSSSVILAAMSRECWSTTVLRP